MSNRFGRAWRGVSVVGAVLIASMLSLPAFAQVRSEGAVPDGRGGVVALSTGYFHTCGLRSDGAAVCWGMNHDGQATPPPGTFIELSAGLEHACGLRGDGSVACWGRGFSGGVVPVPEGAFTALASGINHTCGLRARSNPWDYLAGNVECWDTNGYNAMIPPPGNFIALSAGDEYSCGLRGDGRAECWGRNDAGQATPPADTLTALSAGARHACGLRGDGSIVCWGANDGGQATPPAETFTTLSAGAFHTCGLRSDGSAQCWGDDRAAAVPPGRAFAALSAGAFHACGLQADGNVVCWGDNGDGQAMPPAGVFGAGSVATGVSHTCEVRADGRLGCRGDIEPEPLPWQRFVGVGSGERYSCGRDEQGGLRCWGSNIDAQQGVPWTPVRQFGLGRAHGCAVGALDGLATCWGWNSNGQTVAPVGLFKNVSAGMVHSCGVLDNGNGACWGYNGDGESNVPPLQGGVSYLAIQAGERHSCGLGSDNFLTCWGLGTGYGYGYESKQNPPTGYFRALSVGAFHGCAIRTDGRLACWGENWTGQLDAPVGSYASVSSGSNHNCAIRDDGMRLCWGGPQNLILAPDSLPAMQPAEPYSASLFLYAMEPNPPSAPSFVVAAGALPPGISLGANGELTGTPTTAGSYPVTFEGRDGDGFAVQNDYVLVVDDTPPLLSRYLTGPLGDNGWHVGTAQVDWYAYDPESEVTLTGGCRGFISIDHPGINYVCTAESAGGSVSDSVLIKVDVTKPETTLTAAPPATTDRTDAVFAFTGTDATAGVNGYECSLDGAPFSACVSPLTLGVANGSHNVAVRAVDAAGLRDATPASHGWLVDTTPPTITPTVSGTLGSNGWYVGDVQVSWSVSDAGSAISSASGCNTVTLNTDTPGAGFTCTAVSAGGTSSQTVTVKRDTLAPTIQAAATAAANAAGWYNGAVTVAFSCSDTMSGGVACPAAQVLDGEGTLSSTARDVTDAAGNRATSNVLGVRIDRTAPTLAPAVTPGTVLLNSTAAASANGSDALSGIANQGCAALATASVGSKSAGCTVTDAAGNSASAVANYRVAYGFVGFTSPVANPPALNLFKVGRSVPLRWRVVDAQGAPVTTLGNAVVGATAIACPAITGQRISVYGGTGSQLRNLGNGYYQLDWQAPSAYRNTCQRLHLDLGDGEARPAQFKFN